MVDYNALKKKFPTKDPQKKKKVAAIRAIKREYAAKRLSRRDHLSDCPLPRLAFLREFHVRRLSFMMSVRGTLYHSRRNDACRRGDWPHECPNFIGRHRLSFFHAALSAALASRQPCVA